MLISEVSFLHLQDAEAERFARELELRRLARERYGEHGAPVGPSLHERLARVFARRRVTVQRLHASR